jgi:hypothetical protein
LTAASLIIDQPHQDPLAAFKVTTAKPFDGGAAYNQATILPSHKPISGMPPAIDAGTKGGGDSSYDGADVDIGWQHHAIVTAADSTRCYDWLGGVQTASTAAITSSASASVRYRLESRCRQGNRSRCA